MSAALRGFKILIVRRLETVVAVSQRCKHAPPEGSTQSVKHRVLATVVALAVLIPLCQLEAQQTEIPRLGVILQGGPFSAVVDGLREGLREQRLVEGKQFVLEVRDAAGDLKVVAEAARSLERQKVALIYAVATSVTVAARQATVSTPIVFCAGTDPVALGLVESFAKPGGRLTGVHFLSTDVTGKRLELLKRIVPKLHRVVTFYDPRNPSARESAKQGREAAQRLQVELRERHVGSAEELRAALQSLRPGEVDAYLAVSDAMVDRHAQTIIDAAHAKRLPTMFYFDSLVARGGLASYSVDFHDLGRQSAKHVARVLAGVSPKDVPVESVDRFTLAISMKTAERIGLVIPQAILLQADKVLQ
jgi:putative ABC transport system substrate-binding protein